MMVLEVAHAFALVAVTLLLGASVLLLVLGWEGSS